MMFNLFREGAGSLGGFFVLGLVLKLAWAVAVVWFVVWVVKSIRKANKANTLPTLTSDKSIAIVKERYAKGEITKEQYDQLLADLKN
jgi:putative membrane protein